MPVLYLSHGAPPLADDSVWTRQLADWASGLPEPKAILIVSAHWEEAPLTIGATTTQPLVYDFWGFPECYYQVEYAAPGAPERSHASRKRRRSPGAYTVSATLTTNGARAPAAIAVRTASAEPSGSRCSVKRTSSPPSTRRI